MKYSLYSLQYAKFNIIIIYIIIIYSQCAYSHVYQHHIYRHCFTDSTIEMHHSRQKYRRYLHVVSVAVALHNVLMVRIYICT